MPGPERAKGAFAAAAYLRSRADIDANRIGALGYSHGGWTLLNASTERQVAQSGTPAFAAIVSLYPFCPAVAPPLATDVKIFIGDADDWAAASRCHALVEKYGAEAPHRPSLVVYPGARHSFDAKAPDRVYFGHRLVHDPKATADTIEQTRKFLDDHLRR